MSTPFTSHLGLALSKPRLFRESLKEGEEPPRQLDRRGVVHGLTCWANLSEVLDCAEAPGCVEVLS